MELLYIGYSSILVREGNVMIALDPFLSGEFYWEGQKETYQGKSPLIGNVDSFVEKYAGSITAIAITHAHGDHFEPETILKLVGKNPNLKLFAPRPILDWFKKSGTMSPLISYSNRPVKWNGAYDIERQGDRLTLGILPNPGIKKEQKPERVGFSISNDNGVSIACVGDAHGVGDWEKFRRDITDLILWPVEERAEIINYFYGESKLERIWWIHWEKFHPGNFTCSVDPHALMNEFKSLEIEQGVLSHDKWITLS